MSTSNKRFILELDSVSVNDHRLIPIHDVNLKIRQGEIFSILGDNESGTATVVRVLSGDVVPNRGRIIFNGKKYRRLNVSQSKSIGIETVYKYSGIVPEQSVYENLFMNRYLTKKTGQLDHHQMEFRANQILADFLPNAKIAVTKPLGYYNYQIQNIVDVAKSFCFPARLIILEELKGRLDKYELSRVREIVSRLKDQGVGVLYISQHVDEIYNYADRVAVMKNGSIVNSYDVSGYDKMQLIQMSYTHLYDQEELEKKNFELYYSASFNESIINYLPLAILVTETKGAIVFANKLFSKIFKITIDKYWNKPFNDLLQLSEESLQSVKDCIEDGEIRKIYFGQTDLLASESRYVLYLIPFFDSDNAFLGLSFLWINYLDSIHFENQLDIYGRMISLDETFGKLVHKIRNPLGIIKNYTRIIENASDEKHVIDNVKVVNQEIDKIKEIINGLAVKIHNTSKEQHQNIVHVYQFLHGIKQEIQHWLDDKGIDLRISVHPDLMLSMEQELLTQVLMNIIINSVEALELNGSIVISDSIEKNGRLILTFADNGHGISQDNLQRIFEPFFSTKSTDEIRGLGLSICRDIMQKYGGFIEVDSTLGKGTAFKLYFPGKMIY